MSVNNKLDVSAIIAALILLIIIFINISPANINDDLYFSRALDNSSLLTFLGMRYTTWSGRVLIEAFLVKTINIPYAPAIIITTSFAVFSFVIAKIISPKRQSVGLWLAAMIFILLCSPSATQAIFWVTGGYNYILPFCLGFISLLGFFYERKGKGYCSMCIILAFIAANNEMFGAFSVLFTMLLLLFKIINKGSVRYEVIYLIAAMAGLLFCILAPGNSIRFAHEMASWMPDFEHYNFIDKIALGVDRLNGGVNQKSNISYLLCCATTSLFIYKKKEKISSDLLISIIVLIPVMHACFSNLNITSPLNYVIRGDYMHGMAYDDCGMYISYIITILVIGGIISTLYAHWKSDYLLYFCASCLLAAVGSVVAVGLSPTVHESGVRVMFLLDVAFTISSMAMMKKILSVKN